MGAISLNKEGIASKEELTAKITLKATDGSSEYQRVKLTYPNLPEGLRVNSTSIFLPKDKTEKVYTIKFYNQTESEILLNNVNVTVSLENVDSLLMKHDGTTANDGDSRTYYYVEMGTVMRETENEYIRWRYVADTTRTQGSSTPTDLSSLNGTYLLETDLATEYESDVYEIFMGGPAQEIVQEIDNYLTNNYTGTICAYQSVGKFTASSGNYTGLNTEYNTNANEYKTSTIRRWMNYTGENTVAKHASYSQMGPEVFDINFDEITSSGNQNSKSNMVTDLNIDTTHDEVYTQIIGRTLESLYLDSSMNDENLDDIDVKGLTDSDKFWLLSKEEATNIFTSDVARDWNGNLEIQDDQGNLLMDVYWLRSPNSSDTNYAYYVAFDGGIAFYSRFVISFFAARPAFQIS